MPPETRYAKSGGVNIAYQVVGDGPFDLVYVPGWVSHVELAWELPDLARGFERLASISRLILFDKRGTEMSDPVAADELPTIALCTFGSTAKRIRTPEYPWAPSWEERLKAFDHVEQLWMTGIDWEDTAP